MFSFYNQSIEVCLFLFFKFSNGLAPSLFNFDYISDIFCSNFLMECLKEFYSTYDDTLLKYNGADLVTRVLNRFSTKADKGYGQLNIKIEPPFVFYPISPINITRYAIRTVILLNLPTPLL